MDQKKLGRLNQLFEKMVSNAVSSSENRIEDMITGITLTLNEVTASPFSLQIKQDSTGIKDAINDFVDSYNETRDLLKRVKDIKLEKPAIAVQMDSLLTAFYHTTKYLYFNNKK